MIMCLKSHEERFDKGCMLSRQKKKYRLFVDLFSEAFNTNLPYLSYIILIQILNLLSKLSCLFIVCFLPFSSQRFQFKNEFSSRVITAPLWSSWLGYSALTREARVQFPVGE